MSINYQSGDATAPMAQGSKIIVHICNDVGAWGRGFVMALSRRWPEPEQQYREWHKGAQNIPFALGEVQFVQVAPDTSVANLIGQHGIRAHAGMPPIRFEAVRSGLRKVSQKARSRGSSVHMPRIGCGLAGGKWAEIAPIIEEELVAEGILVTVYDLPG